VGGWIVKVHPDDLIVAACHTVPVEPDLAGLPTDLLVHRIGDGVGKDTIDRAMHGARTAITALAATTLP